jgi:hypothetical protein
MVRFSKDQKNHSKNPKPWTASFVSTSIKRKEKLFAPKLDSLLKDVRCPKGMVFMLRVDASSHYFNKNSVHGNNECDFFVVKCLSILDQLQIDVLSK